ncbi:hypothetical protein EVAR_19969_1 [Eumeta japonica]|uniref:Uncharacterized protein n=1 Tax=Eumeta variegata TaxID=151549 RepID=A0A4C1V9X7_EUMVA|nr:hypothetical protein EVAR_19969_1 [Eumeta japonica]
MDILNSREVTSVLSAFYKGYLMGGGVGYWNVHWTKHNSKGYYVMSVFYGSDISPAELTHSRVAIKLATAQLYKHPDLSKKVVRSASRSRSEAHSNRERNGNGKKAGAKLTL